MQTLNPTQVGALKTGIKGEVLAAGDDGYDAARVIWNAMIDKRPAVIAKCRTAAEVALAVKFAKEHGLPLAVRGGGHNIAGSGLVDDGLVIDLSLMKEAKVDPAAKRITIGGGATLAEFDAACQAHGLVAPVGINSTTGIGGLTLGGGFGWLSRKFGLTVDSLESAEVVTATGEIVRASATENPDLFWALKGGGGNFGVVTRFEFRLHPLGPDILSGLIVYPYAQGKQVLQKFREFVAKAPDELTVWVVARLAPPLPFLPAEVHGKPVIVLAVVYAGDPKKGEALIGPLSGFGTPVGQAVGVQPFTAWQQAFDPLLTPGSRNYWKSHNFAKLDDAYFDVVLDSVSKLPSPHCEVFIGSMGGATSRAAADSAPYGGRDAQFIMNVHGRWDTAAEDTRCIAWARDLFKAATPYASGGVYINFLTGEETDRVKAAYGSNYDRLVQIKRKYDPTNLFRTNQNITP